MEKILHIHLQNFLLFSKIEDKSISTIILGLSFLGMNVQNFFKNNPEKNIFSKPWYDNHIPRCLG